MKSIALICFMACGKSTVGKALAQELGYKFIDTDAEIEKVEGRAIPAIFEADGEDYFRKVESETLLKISREPSSVISTGGGIISRPENIKTLKENCYVVFLDVPFEVMAQRAETNDNRPLFRDREKAYALWLKRYDLYRSTADMIYDSHEDIVLKSARHIAECYRAFLKKHK